MEMLRKCLGLFTVAVCFAHLPAKATEALWTDNNTIAARSDSELTATTGVADARLLTLNTDAMKSVLLDQTRVDSDVLAYRADRTRQVELPMPDGSFVSLNIEPTRLIPESLLAKYTGIRSYRLSEATGRIIAARVDYTKQGFHAMLQTYDGDIILIDPEDTAGTQRYLSYRKSQQLSGEPFQCSTPEAHDHSGFSALGQRSELAARSNIDLIEYRIAIAATAEYTVRQGGTVAAGLSGIVTTLSRVNMVFEQSLGVRLTLVENNDEIIYTNASLDPYSNFSLDTILSENQSNLDQVIGNSNYDIGHVFGTSGGGLAFIGSLCRDQNKAMAASGINSPYGDTFDIDFVAHELGHQFGATHTFNGTLGICTDGARTAYSAFEPGSGSSIMSYAGGCGTDDLQSRADAMFHSGSIEQIKTNILSGVGSSCGVEYVSANQAPTVSAGPDYTIPANTPFQLIASASDPDGDPLLYSWEQQDTGTASTLKNDTGDNPLFRIFNPSQMRNRVFPSMNSLTGREYIPGELLPQTDRTLTFKVAVYDQNHLPSMDETTLTVINTGSPFRLETPASAYQPGQLTEIRWDTGNTQYAPFNCSHVELALSTNNGQSFDTVLATASPNDGAISTTIPMSTPEVSQARFKLSCNNSIFFSISSQAFAISQEIIDTEESTRSTESDTNVQQSTGSGGGSTTPLMMILMFGLFWYKHHTLS